MAKKQCEGMIDIRTIYYVMDPILSPFLTSNNYVGTWLVIVGLAVNVNFNGQRGYEISNNVSKFIWDTPVQ